jgi:hypothetical protein
MYRLIFCRPTLQPTEDLPLAGPMDSFIDENRSGSVSLKDRFLVKKIDFLKKLKIDKSTNGAIDCFGGQNRSMGEFIF